MYQSRWIAVDHDTEVITNPLPPFVYGALRLIEGAGFFAVHSANYEKAMQIFDLHRFFLACVGCVSCLVAVLVGACKSTQKRDIRRALKFAPDLGEAL